MLAASAKDPTSEVHDEAGSAHNEEVKAIDLAKVSVHADLHPHPSRVSALELLRYIHGEGNFRLLLLTLL